MEEVVSVWSRTNSVEREVVQKRTFTRWMNLHLEKCDPPIVVQDLFRDIQDGRILMALLEELSGCKLLHGFKKSSHRIFRLNNIAKVLSFLEERNVKLVSIDAADVADGNSSIILGLIWNIILFFQIKELTGNIRSQFPSCSSLSSIPTSSDSDASHCSTPSDERQSASSAMREHSKAIKKLLQWVQKRTRKYGVAVQDFGKSWTSGLAFLAVIKSIDPSLVDMRKALLRSARENLEDAFRIAHFSLGIPRLLEPEDVTINPPDEQSIITYVSQFLEHFPGIEEPEEPYQLIERSVSMGRLNFRDIDSDHIRNGAHRSRVKERSYMFQGDNAKPAPKILISSVSEDRSATSPPFRPAAARSWSIEDFLADSPHMEDITSNVVEDFKEPANEALSNSTSNSPQLSYTHSPTDSSVPGCANTDSVIGDSAISSPDSWVESEFGVTPEKFCENQSDSSLCDSGTAWDVYRATPVEITTIDEGFVPSIEDRGPESYNDEGIYSLGSLERTQEKIQGHSEKNQAEVLKDREENLEKNNQDMTVKQILDQSNAEIPKEVDSKEMDTSLLQKKDQVPREEEPSFDAEVLAESGANNLFETDETNDNNTDLPLPDHFEELVKQTSVAESTYRESDCLKETVDFLEDAQDHKGQINGQTESLNKRNNSEEAAVESQCLKTGSPVEEIKEDPRDDSWIVKERDEGIVETQDEASEGVLRDFPDPQESISTETGGALANTHPTNQEGAPSIPLISISSEPEEPNEEGTCDPERQVHAEDEEVHQPEESAYNGTVANVNSPQKPNEMICYSNVNDDTKPADIPSCPISEDVKPTASEQITDIENGHLDDTHEHNVRKSSDVDTCVPCSTDNVEMSEAKEFPHNSSHTDNTDKDLTAQTSTDDESQTVNTEQDKLGDSETANTQESTLDPVNSEPNGKIGISYYEPASVPRNADFFYADFDRSSPTEDLVGDPIEPMDLFYPDKEEPMLTEPPDTEMQSWPSVLSVSALQPAPASESLPDDQPLNLLGEDFRDGMDFIQETDKAITKTNQETDKTSESQEQCLLPGEKTGGPWDDDDPAGGSSTSETEQQHPGSARENTEPVRSDAKSSSREDESQISPVLRHRKWTSHLPETVDKQRAEPVATRKTNNGDDFWSESWELYLLLLLWLLLYCFWLLPQMDLKTLPSLLLNLDH
ncbi:calmin isoform X2 [Trachinotus anak]|uniref:calmin isoform X2 n=1 Tax=Trachinotus anak TaxID=443729 RepID=UPI0039F16AD6